MLLVLVFTRQKLSIVKRCFNVRVGIQWVGACGCHGGVLVLPPHHALSAAPYHQCCSRELRDISFCTLSIRYSYCLRPTCLPASRLPSMLTWWILHTSQEDPPRPSFKTDLDFGLLPKPFYFSGSFSCLWGSRVGHSIFLKYCVQSSKELVYPRLSQEVMCFDPSQWLRAYSGSVLSYAASTSVLSTFKK